VVIHVAILGGDCRSDCCGDCRGDSPGSDLVILVALLVAVSLGDSRGDCRDDCRGDNRSDIVDVRQFSLAPLQRFAAMFGAVSSTVVAILRRFVALLRALLVAILAGDPGGNSRGGVLVDSCLAVLVAVSWRGSAVAILVAIVVANCSWRLS
jgi:hypothetical protein